MLHCAACSILKWKLRILLYCHELSGSHQANWTGAGTTKLNWPALRLVSSTNTTELQSFLDLYSVSRRFGPKFVQIEAPVNWKPRKGHRNHFKTFTNEEYLALRTLQKSWPPSVLFFSQSEGPYTPETDSCYREAGLTLLQEQPTDQTRQLVVGWGHSTTQSAPTTLHTRTTLQLLGSICTKGIPGRRPILVSSRPGCIHLDTAPGRSVIKHAGWLLPFSNL